MVQPQRQQKKKPEVIYLYRKKRKLPGQKTPEKKKAKPPEKLPSPTRPLNMKDRGLEEADPELAALIKAEKLRQIQGIELIASENFASKAF